MGIPENYDDEAERVRTPSQLLPKPKEAGVVCVCVWSAVGNDSVPMGPVVRLVHPIRAPLPPGSRGKCQCELVLGWLGDFVPQPLQSYVMWKRGSFLGREIL